MIYLLGPTKNELGGSLFSRVTGRDYSPVPGPCPETKANSILLHAAIKTGLVKSCHDLSDGGLAVAAVEMAILGNLGICIYTDKLEGDSDYVKMFSESNGRWLVEVAEPDIEDFERLVPTAVCCGFVTSNLVAIGPVMTNLEEVRLLWENRE